MDWQRGQGLTQRQVNTFRLPSTFNYVPTQGHKPFHCLATKFNPNLREQHSIKPVRNCFGIRNEGFLIFTSRCIVKIYDHYYTRTYSLISFAGKFVLADIAEATDVWIGKTVLNWEQRGLNNKF